MCDPFGLLVYLYLIIVTYIAVVFKRKDLFSFSLLAIISIIAAFRGNAGIDTPLYIERFENAIDTSIPLLEPLITLIMKGVQTIGGSFSLFSIIWGIIMSFAYWLILRHNKSFIYFGVSVFPVIFIDSLFNGIRIGMAYPFIILAIIYSSYLILLVAFSSHVSSLIAIPFLIKNKKLVVISIIILATLLYLSFDSFQFLPERYMFKFEKYQDLSTKNPYSGIADSIALFISLVILILTKLLKRTKVYIYIAISLFSVMLLHIFLVSEYVFMLRIVRLMMIIVFALIIKQNKPINKNALYLSFTFGFLYTLNFIRQIVETCNYDNGFLPLIY